MSYRENYPALTTRCHGGDPNTLTPARAAPRQLPSAAAWEQPWLLGSESDRQTAAVQPIEKTIPRFGGFSFIKINGTMYKSTACICYFSRNVFSHEKQKRWEKGISGRTKSFYWTCWYHRKETQALGHECPLWGMRGWKPARFSHMPPTRARDCCNMMGRGHRILE